MEPRIQYAKTLRLVTGKGCLFADRGEIVLRGFEGPMPLFEVWWR